LSCCSNKITSLFKKIGGKRLEKVAIFGGAFDPITVGHLDGVCEILDLNLADEVWIVPCGLRKDKQNLTTSFVDRSYMCNLATAKLEKKYREKIKIYEIEGEYPQAVATFSLLKIIEDKYPEKEFFFAIGTDLLSSIKFWDAPGIENAGERLCREFSFLVLYRPDFSYVDFGENFTFVLSNRVDNVSSTVVRAQIRAHKSTKGLVEPVVADFIEKRGLYL
jgi:nicotinate-nucleotide adenylyltransferase